MELKERINYSQGWLMKNRALIMFVVVALYALFMTKSCMNEKTQNQNLIEALKNENQKVTYWKDKNGVEHAKVIEIQLTHEQMDALHQGKLDSMANLLKIKEKQITQYIAITTSTHGQFSTPVDTVYESDTVYLPSDTVKPVITHNPILKMNYKDGWLDFKGDIHKGRFYGEYTMKDSLTFVTYYKNTGFLGLGRRVHYLDVKSDNPNTTILNAKDYKFVEPKDKHVGFGIIGGYGVSVDTKIRLAPYVRVGLFYRIF